MQVSRFLKVLVVLSALILLLPVAAAADPGAAQERPFKVEWSGMFVMGPDESCGPLAEGWVHVSLTITDGHATHMGSVTGWADHCAQLFPDGTGVMVGGEGAFVVANGDELHTLYDGPLGDLIVGRHFFNGGTGRFAGASGEVDASTWVTFDTDWTGVLKGTMVGTILYDASDRRN